MEIYYQAMNKILISIVSLFAVVAAFAQELSAQNIEEETVRIDTIIVAATPQTTLALEGESILSLMPSGVCVNMSSSMRSLLASQIASNEKRRFNGFRVRVIHDNSQSARSRSEAAEIALKHDYPALPIDRIYANQNFSVIAGAFRTRVEAEVFLRKIKGEYPQASIIKEYFKYPLLGEYLPVVREVMVSDEQSDDSGNIVL